MGIQDAITTTLASILHGEQRVRSRNIIRVSDRGAHLVHMTRSAVPSSIWSAFDRRGIMGW